MARPSSPSRSTISSGEEPFDLQDLLDLASARLGEPITARTVRLYATEGLIDRPGKRGRRAVYSERQLLQLLLVRNLARRGLSLSAIAPLVAGSNRELQDQLERLDFAGAAESSLAGHEAVVMQDLSCAADDAMELVLPLIGAPITSSSSDSRRSCWHRLTLAPGVELHLSDTASIPPAGRRREAWLQRLIDRLREQLNQQE